MVKSNDGTKKPQDSDFYQQRLKAWQPMLTPKWVVITFLLIGIPFVIIGFVLKGASDNVVEYSTKYGGSDAITCTNTCTISFTIDKEMKKPVYVYYELTNFYQNHRRYVKSKNDDQLAGKVITDVSKLSDCDPLKTDAASGLILHPCGLIAASYFNDTISLSSSSISNGYSMSESNIAWDTDRTKKFLPPTVADYNANNGTKVSFLDSAYVFTRDGNGNITNISVNEHFIVWMRAAALPDFRKLYGKIDKDIPAGTTLSFDVGSNYPVDDFKGTKSLVISTVSFLGGKNPFLGIAYIVVGFVCIVLSLIFAIKQKFGGRRLGDTSFLVWDTKGSR